MNAQQFRQIIREEVRKAVREELRQVLMEHATSQLTEGYKQKLNESQDIDKTFKFTTNNVDVSRPKPQVKAKMDEMFGIKSKETEQSNLNVKQESGNPWMDFIKDSAQNMTAQELSGLKNMG
jgi:hypothetical protein